MSSADKLHFKADWCTYAAAKYAVETWHYSKRMPMPPLARVGAWEAGKFIGCVLFGRGANQHLGTPYGLTATECAELVRVALTRHVVPVTRVVAVAIKFLKKQSPGLRLIVSFADPSQGHHGGIYQGGNWIYAGDSEPQWEYLHQGRWKHQREVTSGAFGGTRALVSYNDLPKRLSAGKHRYLMPLDCEMRERVAHLAKPYPKRAGTSTRSGAPAEVGGATPTPALQTAKGAVDA